MGKRANPLEYCVLARDEDGTLHHLSSIPIVKRTHIIGDLYMNGITEAEARESAEGLIRVGPEVFVGWTDWHFVKKRRWTPLSTTRDKRAKSLP